MGSNESTPHAHVDTYARHTWPRSQRARLPLSWPVSAAVSECGLCAVPFLDRCTYCTRPFIRTLTRSFIGTWMLNQPIPTHTERDRPSVGFFHFPHLSLWRGRESIRHTHRVHISDIHVHITIVYRSRTEWTFPAGAGAAHAAAREFTRAMDCCRHQLQ